MYIWVGICAYRSAVRASKRMVPTFLVSQYVQLHEIHTIFQMAAIFILPEFLLWKPLETCRKELKIILCKKNPLSIALICIFQKAKRMNRVSKGSLFKAWRYPGCLEALLAISLPTPLLLWNQYTLLKLLPSSSSVRDIASLGDAEK